MVTRIRHSALRAVVAILLTATSCLVASGCQGGAGEGGTTTIAYQPGLGYAPLLIIKHQGWLDDSPGKGQIHWKRLDSGAAIRDGVVSDEIQIAAVGLSPFLIGADKGINWKILASLGDTNFWLMAKNSKYQSLKDLQGAGKIATPAPDSIHAIALRKNAADKLDDPHAFDKKLTPLGHPDGVQALLSGRLAAHYTAPPFQFVEQKKGAHKITDSRSAFGATAFAVLAAKQDFYDENTDLMQSLYRAMKRALTMLQDNPKRAAHILAAESKENVSARRYEQYLDSGALDFTATPHGLTKVGSFMHRIGLIQKQPPTPNKLSFPELRGRSGGG